MVSNTLYCRANISKPMCYRAEKPKRFCKVYRSTHWGMITGSHWDLDCMVRQCYLSQTFLSNRSITLQTVTWKSLSILRAQVGRSKGNVLSWRFIDDFAFECKCNAVDEVSYVSCQLHFTRVRTISLMSKSWLSAQYFIVNKQIASVHRVWSSTSGVTSVHSIS